MNTLELSKAIGQQGDLHEKNGLVYRVQVVNCRVAWNRIDYLVTPVSGSGEIWVSSERVRLSASESRSKETI